jgi:hypothetical protein
MQPSAPYAAGHFPSTDSKKANKSRAGPRMPHVTLSLPIALALIILLLGAGAGVVCNHADYWRGS